MTTDRPRAHGAGNRLNHEVNIQVNNSGLQDHFSLLVKREAKPLDQLN